MTPGKSAKLSHPVPGRAVLAWGGLACAWVVMLVLIDPRGEFPLNDDWSYARAVKVLHDTGRLDFPVPWASMTLIAHVLWGWLVTALFGFSFFMLRMGNLIPAAAGIFGFYALLREANIAPRAAFIAAAATAFSPWYAQLSLSFMTDVSFLAATVWSLVFLLRALNDPGRRNFWIGLGLSLLATMIRQHGIFIAGAWAVAWIWKNGWSRRKLGMAVLPLAVHLLYLVFHRLALSPVLGTHSTMLELRNWAAMVATEGWGSAILVMLSRGARLLIYAGVLAAPVWIYSLISGKRSLTWLMGLLAIAAVLIPFLWQPYTPEPFNIVYNLGIGPPTLRDVYLLGLPNLPTAPRGVWLVFTAVGIFGGMWLLWRWSLALKATLRRPRTGGEAFILLSVFSLGCLAVVPLTPFLDRHMLLFLPLLYFLAAPRTTEEEGGRTGTLAVAAMIAGTAVFSTAGLHDYFAWNRARWEAVEWLTAAHGPVPEEIDGGFEYNGWTTFDPNYHPSAEKSWWWVKGDEYMIAFGPLSGYEPYATFPYPAWVPPAERNIFVLKRITNNPEMH